MVCLALAPGVVLGCAHREGTKGFNPPVPATHAQAADVKGGDHGGTSVTPAGATPLQVGLATWYGDAFAGKKTASGEKFDPHGMTAAHRTLKIGTWVEVRRPDTGRSIRVRINDRGPFGDDRKVIDLARHAAEELDMLHDGVMRVELRVVNGP